MLYDSNSKHSDPWQPGRRGSVCPKTIDQKTAQYLLLRSEVEGNKRYAFLDGQAYCAQEHRPGLWHGYPVGRVAVPMRLRQKWQHDDVVRRSDFRRNWD